MATTADHAHRPARSTRAATPSRRRTPRRTACRSCPQVGNVHQLPLPIKEQATAEVTLTWDDPSLLPRPRGQGRLRPGGRERRPLRDRHRPVGAPRPRRLGHPVAGRLGVGDYTLTAKLTTLTANADGDARAGHRRRLPRRKAGPASSGGCPDTDRDGILDTRDACATVAGRRADGCPTAADEKVVAFLDGKQVSTHVRDDPPRQLRRQRLGRRRRRGTHTLKLVWYSGSKVVSSVTRTVTVG